MLVVFYQIDKKKQSLSVNVDEWLNAAAAETLAVEEEEASQRSSSSVSVSRTDSEGPTVRTQLLPSCSCTTTTI